MRQLRDAQGADFRGNKIPAAATDGSVNWIRLDNLPVMGRVVVIGQHGGVDCSRSPQNSRSAVRSVLYNEARNEVVFVKYLD